MNRYTLHNKQKFVCPNCGHTNKYQRYIDNTTGNLIDEKYGRCDREDTCQYWEKPENETINVSDAVFKPKVYDLYTSDVLDSELYINTFHLLKNKYSAYSKSNLNKNKFIDGLNIRFDVNLVRKAYKDYNLGMCFNGSIIFPYYFNNELKTGKIISYNEDLHRNKTINPNWLHSVKTFNLFNCIDCKYDKIDNILYPEQSLEYEDFLNNRDSYSEDSECDKFDYCIPLFGWDLLNKRENKIKTICIVEAEKTAIICSIVFPQFVWLATGGKSFLQSYKFTYHSGRNWLIFPDLSLEDKTLLQWKDSINKIKMKYNMFETFIDYMPKSNNSFNDLAKEKGYDIADYILEYPNFIDYMNGVLEPYITGNNTVIKTTVKPTRIPLNETKLSVIEIKRKFYESLNKSEMVKPEIVTKQDTSIKSTTISLINDNKNILTAIDWAELEKYVD